MGPVARDHRPTNDVRWQPGTDGLYSDSVDELNERARLGSSLPSVLVPSSASVSFTREVSVRKLPLWNDSSAARLRVIGLHGQDWALAAKCTSSGNGTNRLGSG